MLITKQSISSSFKSMHFERLYRRVSLKAVSVNSLTMKQFPQDRNSLRWRRIFYIKQFFLLQKFRICSNKCLCWRLSLQPHIACKFVALVEFVLTGHRCNIKTRSTIILLTFFYRLNPIPGH